MKDESVVDDGSSFPSSFIPHPSAFILALRAFCRSHLVAARSFVVCSNAMFPEKRTEENQITNDRAKTLLTGR
jgi:hypothetical protein